MAKDSVFYQYVDVDICPKCNDVMAVKDNVTREPLSPGMAFAGSLIAGPAGAVVGASMGKTSTERLFKCSNIVCGEIYDIRAFREWKYGTTSKRGIMNKRLLWRSEGRGYGYTIWG